jgi:methyl-accepting chemotaxis protein
MRNSIRTRLTLAFIGLAVCPLLLVGIVLAWQSFTTQQQQALNLQREVAQRVSSQVTAFLQGVESELLLTSWAQELPTLNQDKQRSILSNLRAHHDVFEELALLDSQGQELVHVTRLNLAAELRNRAAAAEFVNPHASGQTYYSPIWFEEATGEPFMTIAVPLLDMQTGLVDAVLVSDVRVRKIRDLIASLKLSPGQSVYIVDAQGKVVAHRNPSVVLQGTTFPVPDQGGIQPGLASVNPMLAVDTGEGLSVRALVAQLTSPNVVLAMDTVRFGEQEFTIIAEQMVAEALALAISTILVTAGLLVAVLVISGLLGFVIVRQLVRPLQSMARTAQAISAGDLAQQVEVASQDEVGVLAAAFNSMTGQLRSLIDSLEQRNQHLQETVQHYVKCMVEVERGNLAVRVTLDDAAQVSTAQAGNPLVVLGQQLNEMTASLEQMITQIQAAADQLHAATTEILAATTQQVSGTTQQSAALAQASTTVDEVKVISEQAVARAQGVMTAARRTVDVSRGGQTAVAHTIESMEQIKERVEAIAANILTLSEQTQQVEAIIATVNDIATQSNILALNASIEAARAGEQGKGFAVVAVEVRNLAKQSKQATEQVKALLSEIQRSTNTAVMATEEGTKEVDKGVAAVAQARAAIEQLAGVIEEAVQATEQMAAGGRQQATGVEQIALAMQSVSQATLQGLASTHQTEKAAQNLSELAHQLSQTVARHRS